MQVTSMDVASMHIASVDMDVDLIDVTPAE